MEDESYPEIVAIFLTPLISNHPCKTISLCNYAFSLIITFLLSLHRHFSFILLVFQGHFCSFAQKFLIIQQLFILYSHITILKSVQRKQDKFFHNSPDAFGVWALLISEVFSDGRMPSVFIYSQSASQLVPHHSPAKIHSPC